MQTPNYAPNYEYTRLCAHSRKMDYVNEGKVSEVAHNSKPTTAQ